MNDFVYLPSIDTAKVPTNAERACCHKVTRPFPLAQPSLPFCLSLTPRGSYRLNRPFNDPGQAAKVGGNAPPVNISSAGPLVTQKLLYIRYVCLLRFDQTDGKIVAYGVEPEWGYPSLPTKPLQHQLH